MVLVGKVNQEIVGLLQKCGGKAMGISGIDGNTIMVKKMGDGSPARWAIRVRSSIRKM